jgi:hypothetical protein
LLHSTSRAECDTISSLDHCGEGGENLSDEGKEEQRNSHEVQGAEEGFMGRRVKCMVEVNE